jgi:outer membrane lipoprotein SlyB
MPTYDPNHPTARPCCNKAPSVLPVSGFIGGAALGNAIAGVHGAIVGAVVGCVVGALASRRSG